MTSASANKFAVYHEATSALDRAQIPYVVGGGLAVRAYGRIRESKDMDVFVAMPRIQQTMNVLNTVGFHTRDTDASWLYKALKGEVLVDLIVRTTGDIRLEPEAIRRGRWADLDAFRFYVMGPEDLLLRKVFSEAEGRPDWYDALSMLKQPIPGFDWQYFLELAFKHGIERVLSLLLFAKSDGGREAVPDWVLQVLCQGLLGRRPASDFRLVPHSRQLPAMAASAVDRIRAA